MTKCKTIWISDIHLGSQHCQADKLLKFLKSYDSENLILVGDIIDFWSLKRKMFWPEDHNTVIQKLLRKARHGTKIVYIPGNHDESVRHYDLFTFGGISIADEYVYTSVYGKKILCIHGDQFDTVVKYHKWLAVIGDIGYYYLVWLNKLINKFRNRFGFHPWSLSSYIKGRIKEVGVIMGDYKDSLSKYAKIKECDAVLCGHIHKAEMVEMNGLTYYNCGDWVETCSAIVEHFDGKIEIVKIG